MVQRSSLFKLAVLAGLTVGCAGQGPAPASPMVVPIPAAAFSTNAPAPTEATLFLIGDAGLIGDARDRVLAHVGRSADALTASVPGLSLAAVFLGDNVYDEGVRPDHLEADTEILAEQVALGGGGLGLPRYFLPGNHDWADGGSQEEGLRRLRLQANAIASLADAAGTRAALLPEEGCPGPEVVDLGEGARLLLIDSEWMIRRATTCAGRSRADFLSDLRAGMEGAGDRPVFVLTHHPLATGGVHGAGASWVRKLWRWAVDYRQDLGSTRYDAMADDLMEAARAADIDRLVIASGHEHTLQVIETERDGVPFVQLVSGSAAKQSGVGPVRGTRFHASRPGYMRVDFVQARVLVTVFALEQDGDRVEAVWRGELHPALEPAG